MRRITFLMLFSCILGSWGLTLNFFPVDANPSSTSTPTLLPSRDINIEVVTKANPWDLFVIGEIFDLRDTEGFQIWTHQSHFWLPGDFFDADSLDVEVIFDHTLVIEPFVFWRSSVMQDVYDEGDNLIGRFLAADMNISVRTSALDLGEHTMMVRVQTPHGQVLSQSWQFVIRERETPRLETPPEIAPTADYLRQFPQPTPAFLVRLSTKPVFLDRFSPIGSREGLCLTLDDDPFVPRESANNPFRLSMWDEITISVDGTALNDDQIEIQQSDSSGVLFLCIDTDFLAADTHLAELSVTANGGTYVYQWAFAIK